MDLVKLCSKLKKGTVYLDTVLKKCVSSKVLIFV